MEIKENIASFTDEKDIKVIEVGIRALAKARENDSEVPQGLESGVESLELTPGNVFKVIDTLHAAHAVILGTQVEFNGSKDFSLRLKEQQDLSTHAAAMLNMTFPYIPRFIDTPEQFN